MSKNETHGGREYRPNNNHRCRADSSIAPSLDDLLEKRFGRQNIRVEMMGSDIVSNKTFNAAKMSREKAPSRIIPPRISDD